MGNSSGISIGLQNIHFDYERKFHIYIVHQLSTYHTMTSLSEITCFFVTTMSFQISGTKQDSSLSNNDENNAEGNIRIGKR